MYRKASEGWLKHLDFILLDLICLQIAFFAAYMVRQGIENPYVQQVYQKEAIMLVFIQLIAAIIGENFKNISKRGHFEELIATVKQAVVVTLVSAFYLFLVQAGEVYSRTIFLLTGAFYLLLSYLMRLIWKKHLERKAAKSPNQRTLLVITETELAEQTIQNVSVNNFANLRMKGIAIVDQDLTGKTIGDVPVVADKVGLVEYVCREWVDEVIVNVTSDKLAVQIMRACSSMGVTVHRCLPDLGTIEGRQQKLGKLGSYTVLTTSVNIVPAWQLVCKRILDIMGGIVGCFFAVLFTVIVGPIIYIKSPGPIFFGQVRIGRNGKKFKMYKFRSMYMDAEERKKELMAQNQVQDGMMFKMKDDPRIIKGIGNFIRKTSIDEFPQFFNVLMGDMSLVGTRPPTVDEWEKYTLHHRARLAVKPGITGMWQVSGRSDITDFEEVVRLDTKYIEEWNIALDIKILLKTVSAVFKNDGAM